MLNFPSHFIKKGILTKKTLNELKRIQNLREAKSIPQVNNTKPYTKCFASIGFLNLTQSFIPPCEMVLLLSYFTVVQRG